MLKSIFVLTFLVAVPIQVRSHGMVMDPVNRASRWRVDPSAPVNWDDNQLYCGSFGQHHVVNGGKCGLCGDNYSDAIPRAHELGGTYGQGVIVKSYTQGSTIDVVVNIVANHKGYFLFNLCNLDKFVDETEECYEDIILKLPNGDEKHTITENLGNHEVSLKLPAGLTCDHCVLRWTYVTANSWGNCGDGTSAQGCGPQEWFRTCSDISIKS